MDKATLLRLTLTTFLSLFVFTSVKGAERVEKDRLLASDYSMLGLRLGFWGDLADQKPQSDDSIDADMPDAGFYTELFFDYRLYKPLFVEISLGIASRGDVVIKDGDDRYIGNINLYPVLVQAKLAPLAGKIRSPQPFIIAGGGFVFGRQKIDIIDFGRDDFYNPDIVSKTETDFIGVIGGGIDLPMSEQLGLNLTAKYHPIKFGKTLAGLTEYSGISISVGVSYFLHEL